jgi:hypothetical protein
MNDLDCAKTQIALLVYRAKYKFSLISGRPNLPAAHHLAGWLIRGWGCPTDKD